MSRLAKKTVFITGASSGIGLACAKAFAKEGSNLVLTARRLERLKILENDLKQSFPSIQICSLQMDVQNVNLVKERISSLAPPFSNIDVLVNNAGLVIGVDTIENVADEAIDTMINTNVKGLLHVTKHVLPIMKKRNQGHIINISSISGKEVYPGGGIYCATKHAVDAITRTLRMELVNTPINVSSIEPGLVETEFSMIRFGGDSQKASNVYKGLMPLNGDDVAETVVFVASRPPHVQIASMVIFPSQQAAVNVVSRDQKQ